MIEDGLDLFGHRAAPPPPADVDLDYALVSRPSDDAAVLRRADWVARRIGPMPPGLGSYDRTAFRELVSAYVSGRHMSCVLLAAGVIERHVTLMHRVLGQRWRGSLEEKIERLREVDTPIGFLRPELLATVAAARSLGGEVRPRRPVFSPDGAQLDWDERLAYEAQAALPVAIFVMTRLPVYVCKAAKGQP